MLILLIDYIGFWNIKVEHSRFGSGFFLRQCRVLVFMSMFEDVHCMLL